MRLLIDIGNTRLKWCCDSSAGLSGMHALDYRNSDEYDHFLHCWERLDEPECIGISCVGAVDVRDMIIHKLRDLWPSVAVLVATTEKQALGVVNGYFHPEALGIDRWLAILAAFRQYSSPLCIVDCGTAITADWVDANGLHQGGLITPGLGLMQKALLSSTARLDESALHASINLARDTASGIANGTVTAAVGFIEALRVKLDSQCTWVLTGGDADAIAAWLNFDVIVDPLLVMKGLSMMCQQGCYS